MNRLLKYLFLTSFFIIILIVLFSYTPLRKLIAKYEYPDNPPSSISLFHSYFVSGRSMEPTLMNGEQITYNISLIPEVNNLVVFDCFTEKCINGDPENGKLKRLIKIDNRNCYWFEGDNKELSWDSRNYGWLCSPDDIKILGVVVN